MQNEAKWKPSKYVYRRGRLIASRNPKEVGISSRLIADLSAGFLDGILRQHVKGRVLDLGCGKVPLYEVYRYSATEVVCVDWANTLHKNDYLDREVDLSGDLPFSDREFDTIILSDVLEHIPVPERLWKEMARILSREGKIIVNVPFYYWIHEQPYDYYRYTEFALRRFVEGSGLRLIQLEPIGGAPEVMADIFAKNVLPLPKLGPPIAMMTQALTLALMRTKLGKKISAVTSGSFPLGYFLVAERRC